MDAAQVINRALARIGCLPIQSVAAPGPAGTEVVKTYHSVLDDLLSKYPWHMTRTFSSLSRETDGEVGTGWQSKFQLPPDRIALPRAYYENTVDERPLMRFDLTEGAVLTNTATCVAEYARRPSVAHWAGYFTELMVLVLAAEYALEVREDKMLRRELRADAYGPPQMMGDGGQFKLATDADSQSRVSQQPAGGANPLTDARTEGQGYTTDDARYGW